MLAVALNPLCARIGLAGAGAPALRRLAALRTAGVAPAIYAADAALSAAPGARPGLPDAVALAGLQLLYIAGLEPAAYTPLAQAAREAGVLVNVEDVPALCDFSSVAEVRRGDLLLTVSTGGAAPGLAGVIRRALENLFPPVWAARVEEIAALRQGWRAERLPMAEAAQRIAILAAERCWLPCPAIPESD